MEEKNKISKVYFPHLFLTFKKSCPHLFFILKLQMLDTDQANQEKPDSSNLGNWSWASASPTLVVWFWIKLAKPLICKMRMKIVPPHRDIGRTEWNNGNPLQYSCLENPMDRGAWSAAVHGVSESRTWLGDFTFTFHFHALEKEMATHSSVLAWRIPGTGEPGGLLSMGSHRVGHDWSDLAAAEWNKFLNDHFK